MEFFTIIGVVAVVFAAVFFFKEFNSSGSSHSSSSSRNSSSCTSYPPVGQTRKPPVVKTPAYPNICASYKKHYPIIKNAVHQTLSFMDYYDYITSEEVEDEIRIFMFFLTINLADRDQMLNEAADFIVEIGAETNPYIIDDRMSVYEDIFNGIKLPRVDWGRPVSKYALMHDDVAIKRVYCAFGDFLINPSCRQNYFDAPALSSELVIQSIYFSERFENEIFEKIADFTQCFPNYLKYQ